jgi:hypothetical protein
MGEAQRRRGLFGAVAPVLACVVLPFALMGCLEGAPLEAPERFEALKEPAPPTNCDQPLPSADAVECEWEAPLRQYCGRSCHGEGAVAGLDLVPGPLFIARILDQPAKHGSSTCPGGVACDPAAATCDVCSDCPDGALLLDSANPDQSWILRKIAPFVPGTTTANVPIGCGDAMPSLLTTGIGNYAERDKTCLTLFFRHIATQTPNPERWPCTVSVDGGTDGGT